MKTRSINVNEVNRRWFVIDMKDKVLGRAAARIAAILRGKHRPTYTPHVDTGDFVIVVNADKAILTGKKLKDKRYFLHSGYPGGLREFSAQAMLNRKPTEIFSLAVRGMLPHNSLGRQMLRKLKIYTTPEHPHQAQKPEPLDL